MIRNKLNRLKSGLAQNLTYYYSNKKEVIPILILIPVSSILILLISNPTFSYQALKFDITSFPYVMSENFWLVTHESGISLILLGLLYTILISVLLHSTYKQISYNKNMSSITSVLGVIPSLFVGCAGCSAGIIGILTSFSLVSLPVEAGTLTYVFVTIGILISIYTLSRIGNPKVCEI